MGTKLAIDIINEALAVSHDTGVRFPKPDWLKWLNAAQLAVVEKRPDSLVTNAAVNVVGGQSKQALPADGLRLIEVVNDVVTGKVIRIVPRDTLDVHAPTWHTVVGDPEQYVYDLRDPKNYYIYPHPAAARSLNMIYSKAPNVIVISDYDTDTSTIEVDDIYANYLLDFMLWRAYSKDSEAGNLERALTHYRAFEAIVGKVQVDSALHPQANKGKQ